jgi:hypothetical protein
MTVSLAAHTAGISKARVHYLVRKGRVATQPGLHGKLVRLADVLAYAAATQARDGRGTS